MTLGKVIRTRARQGYKGRGFWSSIILSNIPTHSSSIQMKHALPCKNPYRRKHVVSIYYGTFERSWWWLNCCFTVYEHSCTCVCKSQHTRGRNAVRWKVRETQGETAGGARSTAAERVGGAKCQQINKGGKSGSARELARAWKTNFWKNGRKLWKDRNSQQFIIKSVYLRTTGPGYLTRGTGDVPTRKRRRRAGPDLNAAHACADERCQSALAAFLLLPAGGVSPPLIPPGTHRWKLLMASPWRRAWLGCDSRTPGAGAAECGAILAGRRLVWGSHFKQESAESGGWRSRRGRDALLCTADTRQWRSEVSAGGFQEATKLFGAGEKHVNVDQSVSSSSYLGLASTSRWNQMTRRTGREEKRRHLKCLHRCSKKDIKKEKSTTSFTSARSAAGVAPNLSN